MKSMICMIIIVAIAFITIAPVTAYIKNNASEFIYTDHTGSYSVRCKGSSASINKYSSVNKSAELTLRYSIDGVCGYEGDFLFLCNDSANDQLVVYVYSLDSDCQDSFCIYGKKLYYNTDFCCDGSFLYIENPDDPTELLKYRYNGSYAGKYSFDSEITSMFCGYSSGIFILSYDSLYRIDSGGFIELSGDRVDSPAFAASDNYLVSRNGSVYSVSGGVRRSFDIDTDDPIKCACVAGGTLYCYLAGQGIVGFNLSSGKMTCYYKTNGVPESMYCDGSKIICAGSDGSSVRIDLSSFTLIADEDSSNHNITSDVYRVSFNDMTISGITPGTTVDLFKKNMDYQGYEVMIYLGESFKKSGNICTAMNAVFTSEDINYSFELSVTGDLTGDGKVSDKDLKLLMDRLIGTADFNGVYSLAADLSKDGKIDVIDLAMLKHSVS